MRLAAAVNIDDLRRMAKRRLPRLAYDFIEGGVEDEHGLRRNTEAFRRYRIVPRYLVDVSARDQSRELFGVTYASPFGICPMGLSGLWRPRADEMLAQAAAAAGIPFLMSTSSNASIETAMRIAPNHTWYQLYGSRDREITRKAVRRVGALGVKTLVITVDVPVAPRRERNLRNNFTRPLRFRASTVLDGLRHSAWLAGYLRHGVPMMENWAPYAAEGATADQVADVFAANTPNPTVTWEVLEEVRQLWPGTLVVKGLLHPDDAARATATGADGIIVSNHGGRQLDAAPAPLEVLPAIRAAVGDEQVLMLDGGITRGADILVALCLGVRFVFVGRAVLYGVAAAGLPGAAKAIDLLRREIDVNLAQMGCTDLHALSPDRLLHPTA